MALTKTKDLVRVFRELANYAQPTSAVISNQSTASTLIVNTKWSQRDLEKGEKTTFCKNYILSTDGGTGLKLVSSSQPQEVSNVLWDKESPSGTLRAVIVKAKNKKGDEKQYIEIWNSSKKLRTFDVQSSEKHGKIYESDGQFGCLEWSPLEQFLVYIAEKKVAKTGSYFKEETKQQTAGEEEVTKGDEHLYREDWGEQLVDKHHPVPCVINVQSGDITVLDNIPAQISAGQATWEAGDAGVVFVGWQHEPFRLGLIYCYQRKSGVYYVDVNNTKCDLLSEENRAVCSPKFNGDRSELFYLDRPACGGHNQCARLMRYDWKAKKTEVIVDIVKSAKDVEFAGLYSASLLPNCVVDGGKKLIVDTYCRSRQVPFVIDLDSKSVVQLNTGSHKGTCVLMDVWHDFAVLQASAPNQRNFLMVGRLEGTGTRWLPLEEEGTMVTGMTYALQQHSVPPERVHPKFPDLSYESFLCLPTSSDQSKDSKPPLIIFPHGGPHTTFDAVYQLYTAGFCKCGYAVLMVNYRGSTGFGQDSVQSLLGNVGDQDVKDVWGAVVSVLESGSVDPDRLFVFGGSHGGFLTTHLIGQYPGQFKAAACRNPVIDLTTMNGSTDIPDWVFEESGHQYDHTSLVNPDILADMWRRSPLSYVDKVTTPLLLAIGKNDMRVPPIQARQYYRSLKARNREVRFLAYDDNCHPIVSVPAESDCFVNIMKWFGEHLV